jgi:hypothetical protein
VLPLAGQQRTLIDFEDTLTGILRQRYAVPAADQITAAVWARASIGALRTALAVTARHPPADDAPGTPVMDTIRACFAALDTGQARR